MLNHPEKGIFEFIISLFNEHLYLLPHFFLNVSIYPECFEAFSHDVLFEVYGSKGFELFEFSSEL